MTKIDIDLKERGKKPKRAYTVSEKVIERNRKVGFASRKEDINRSGKGGFGDNPQNINANKKRKSKVIPDDWWNSYRECLRVFSEMELDTFFYLAGKYGITEPTELTDPIKNDIDMLYSQEGSPRKLTNLVDTCIRTLVQAKNNPKLMISVMENIEGRATQRTETVNTNLNQNTEEVEALKKELADTQHQLDRILLAKPAETSDQIEFTEGEIIE